MDAETGHNYEKYHQDVGLHSVIEGDLEGDHETQPEKKSVIKKVKAKAKKIKDTLTKHGHDHEHQHQHQHQHDRDYDEGEDDDGDEEMVEDPDVHGAPMYDSEKAVASTPGQNVNKVDSEPHLGRQTAMGEGRHTAEDVTDAVWSASHGGVTDEPRRTGQNENMGKQRVSFGNTERFEEDPQGPKEKPDTANYETKVSDPSHAGGEELGITPILQSFGKMNVFDNPKHESELKSEPNQGTGTHDQFAPEPTNPESHPPETRQPSYTEKISSGASALTGKAISAKNIVASKLGYGGTHTTSTNTNTNSSVAPGQNENMGKSRVNLGKTEGFAEDPQGPKGKTDASNYETKVSDPSHAGGEELSVSFGKMNVSDNPKHESEQDRATGTHDQFSPEPMNPELHPPETRSNPTSYTEKLSSGASAITERAISAKNIVASKLGYGGTDNANTDSNASAAVPGYGQKIAATVTGTLAPVYGKVTGAGSAVVSKVTGSKEVEGGEKEEKLEVSEKEMLNWTDKLRPSEEDKALSEVISDALHKRKSSGEREPQEDLMARVTESEEVKKQLGEGDGVRASDSAVSKGMVQLIRGAVGTLFGKGGEAQADQPSLDHSHGNEGQQEEPISERKLQESSN